MVETAGTTGTTAKPDFSQLIDQAQREYDRVSNSGDPKAKADAALKLVLVYIQSGTLESEVELNKTLQSIAPTLMKALSETRLALAKDGATKSLELLKARFEEQRKLLEKESKDLFDLAKAGSEPTIRLMGTFKGLALLLKGLGIDTTEFVKFCDDTIAQEQSKLPKINTSRLDDARVDVQTIAAELRVSGSAAAAIGEATDKAPQLADAITRVGRGVAGRVAPTPDGGTQTQTSGTGSATTADIATTRAISAIQSGLGITTKLDVQSIVRRSAGSDGRADTVSSKDWDLIQNKLSMGFVNQGEATNQADAEAKARRVIALIQEKSREGPVGQAASAGPR
jgi:hypothetical protein